MHKSLTERIIISASSVAENVARKYFPQTQSFDAYFAWIEFLATHGRAPVQSHYCDILCQLKMKPDMRSPLRAFVSDKEFVKVFVAGTVGSKYNVPTYAVLGTATEVKTCDYPDACCIKATHTSGNYIVREAGEEIDVDEIASWLRINYYRYHREANYQHLSPKIIVEPLIFGGANPPEYKYICYDGVPKLILHISDRTAGIKKTYFDLSWNFLPIFLHDAATDPLARRPKNLEEMNLVALELSKYFSLVRIDMYSNGDEIKIGEITNCDANAEAKFHANGGELIADILLQK